MSWADMSGVDQSRSASLLLDAVEKGAFLLANNLYEGRFSDRAPNVGTWLFFSYCSARCVSHWVGEAFKELVLVFVQIWRCTCSTRRQTYRT